MLRRKNRILSTIILLALSLVACGKDHKNNQKIQKMEECEAYVISQFYDLYDTEVEVSYGELSDVDMEWNGEQLTEEVYSCKVRVVGELYDAVVHIDEEGNLEMYTTYEDIIGSTICTTLGYNDYWGITYYRRGKMWGLEHSEERVMEFRTSKAFDDFAEALTKLDLDSFETACFVRVKYMDNCIFVPIRKEYTAEDYRQMLDQLLPQVEIIDKEKEHVLMFSSRWSSGWCRVEEGDWTAATYNVYYDGIIEITFYYEGEESKVITVEEMSDYDYSLLRNALETEFVGYEYGMIESEGVIWRMEYYDMSGELLYKIYEDIYGSDLLYDRIQTIVEKYSIK